MNGGALGYMIIRARKRIFAQFRPFFGRGIYYRNPVNWKGVKSRNFWFAVDLLKTAIYRKANHLWHKWRGF
jgi:hypothetical protein